MPLKLKAGLLLVLCVPMATQASQHSDGALAAAVEAALISSAERHGLPQHSVVIEHAAEQRFSLGATLDLQTASTVGLEVLAIETNSAASRLGLRVGDRVQSINGRSLTNGHMRAADLVAALGVGLGAITTEVMRGATTLTLSGHADAIKVPAYRLRIQPSLESSASGCGFVSGGARQSGKVMRVRIVAVNGNEVSAGMLGRLKLAAGRHRLSLVPRTPTAFSANYASARLASASLPRMAGQPTLPSAPTRGDVQPLKPRPAPPLQAPPDIRVDIDVQIAPDTHYQLGLGVTPDGKGVVPLIWREMTRACSEID